MGLHWSRLRRSGAFTLIELLVVVLVLAILVAVAAPSFLGHLRKAQDSEAKQYLTVAYKAAKASAVREQNQGDYVVLPDFDHADLAAAIDASEPYFETGFFGDQGQNEEPKRIVVDDQDGANSIKTDASRLVIHNQSKSGNYCTLDTGVQASAVNTYCNESGLPAPSAVSGSGPTVSGTAQEGFYLTANPGSWAGSPTSYSYQWQQASEWADVAHSPANTSEPHKYLLTSANVGHNLRVCVVAHGPGGDSAPVCSDEVPTSPATVLPAAPVANGSPPSISGQVTVGSVLTASAGDWAGSPSQYSYQWRVCDDDTNAANCVDWGSEVFSTATTATKQLTSAEVGKHVRVAVKAENAGGFGPTQISAATAQVYMSAPVNTTAPSLSGTPREGYTLTADPGQWTNNPTYSYQWQREAGYETAVLADQPLGYWRLGEASGGTAIDSSGNGRAGSYGSGVSLGQADALVNDPNSAAAFDGSFNGYVDVSSNAYPTGRQPASMEAWFNVSSFPADRLTVIGYGSTTVYQAFTVAVCNCSPRRLQFRINGADSAPGGTTISAGTWYHVVAVDDGEHLRLYLNGNLEILYNPGVSFTKSAQSARIGRWWLSGGDEDPFVGTIDEAAIYGHALSQTRAQAHYAARLNAPGFNDVSGATDQTYLLGAADVGSRLRAAVTAQNAGGSTSSLSGSSAAVQPQTFAEVVMADGPEAYWRFDESSSSAAMSDVSGNGNAGSYQSGTSLNRTGALSDNNKAAQFNGSTNYAEAPSSSSLNAPSSQLTLEAWVNLNVNTFTNQMPIVVKQTNPTGWYQYGLFLADDASQSSPKAAGFYLKLSTGDAYLGVNNVWNYNTGWYHIVATYDGSHMRIFVNGAQVAVKAQTGTIVSQTSPVGVAAYPAFAKNSTYLLPAVIDEVAIYDTALSSSRVQRHYDRR